MKSVRAHRIGFYEPKTHSIRCLAYDRENCFLAVSRSDSSIELWNVKEIPFLEKILPSSLSVETLTFCGSRLFSAGLDGYIVEHNLNSFTPKYQLIVTSGCPIWCIKGDKRKKFLAVGNEDGHVVLHELSLEGLNFDKKFDKQEGGILCLDWSHDGEFIATGSIDAIRIWNVNSGTAINRILLSRATKNTPTFVWCLAVLSDMTIVSGDSTGKTSFWESNTGTLISAIGSKNQDILTLTVSEDENELYTSGVDPAITLFMKAKPSGQWIKSIRRMVHTHDVRALQLVSEFLASGGDDCNLVFSKYPPKTVVTYFPHCQRPHAVTAPKASCILMQYPDFLQIYGLELNSSFQGNVPNPKNLLKVACRAGKIISSSISSDGKWLAYSSQHKLKLFNIRMNDTNLPEEIHNVEIPPQAPSTAKVLTFAPNQRLICYSENKFYVIACDILDTKIEAVHEESNVFLGGCHLMEISPNDLYLACASHSGHVLIYSLFDWKLKCTLPLYKCQATALQFNPSSETLVVAYSNRKVIEYNIEKMKYTPWSSQSSLTDLQISSYNPITSLCFVANRLLLQDENAIYSFDMDATTQPSKKQRGSDNKEIRMQKRDYNVITKYEHISSIHSISDELIVVQINENLIFDSLPPPIWKKRYGT